MNKADHAIQCFEKIRDKLYHVTFSTIEESTTVDEDSEEQTPITELTMRAEAQSQLKYPIELSFRNNESLELHIGQLIHDWPLDTDSGENKDFFDAVVGFVEGKYRVVEHYRNNECVKATLEVRTESKNWEEIGSCIYRISMPWHKNSTQELYNR